MVKKSIMSCRPHRHGIHNRLFSEGFVRSARAARWTSRCCDNITYGMDSHHHHHPGHTHPPATVSPSILRLSALERLAAVAVLIAALWGAVIMAMASGT